MATNREMHYWPKANRTEYWHLAGGVWEKVPAQVAEFWQGDTVRYLLWAGLNATPHEPGNYPPRTRI